MSTDFDAHLAFGFVLTREELDERYRKPFPEVSRLETRYDEMTGERREVKVIVRDAEELLTADGVTPLCEDASHDDYDDQYEMLIVRLLPGVQVWLGGDLRYKYPSYLIVGPGELDLDELCALNDHEVMEARVSLVSLETKLRDLGLDPGFGGFHAYGVVG